MNALFTKKYKCIINMTITHRYFKGTNYISYFGYRMIFLTINLSKIYINK